MATSFNSTLPEIYDTYPAVAPAKYAGKLNGKVALITGVSGGIGRSVAKAFGAAGASVAAVARPKQGGNTPLHELVDEIKAAGGNAIAIEADVADNGAPQHIVSTVEKQLGPVDILINNAGISRINPFDVESEDLDAWWKVYEVNVKAPVALIRAVLPSMKARNSGILMTTGSSVATLPLPVMTAYASSKAAISKFHESLSKELESTNILSFSVHPGMVAGTGLKDGINFEQQDHPEMQKFLSSISGEYKSQTPEVCADTMVALCADPAYKVLTGHHLNSTQELPPVLKEAQKEGKGRLGAERLYLVNIATL